MRPPVVLVTTSFRSNVSVPIISPLMKTAKSLVVAPPARAINSRKDVPCGAQKDYGCCPAPPAPTTPHSRNFSLSISSRIAGGERWTPAELRAAGGLGGKIQSAGQEV